MAWMLTPWGIGILAVLIIGLTSLVYWQLPAIKSWLGSRQVDEVELGAGPLKVKLTEKDAEAAAPSNAGVDFGEGGDFTGARIKAAGRDIRRGAAAAESGEGDAPGVTFGKEGKFRDAEIEAGGRDVVDTS
jgi:hypothetical protein